MSRPEKFILGAGFLVYFGLLVFSYGFVDLNLTLSQSPLALSFVGALQKLAYYNRPLSTNIYIAILTLAFSIFGITLFLSYRQKLSRKFLITSTIIFTLVLIFAYPFLSADLFNYMFDAKIITVYHSSPYTHRALDFPNDDWIRFMRWVHRYSPYGPLWIGLSLIPSLSSFGKFLADFYAFKVFIGIFHLINTFLIYKILKKINPTKAIFGAIFYSLNPALLIEGVANAHNDVVLATFLIATVYFVEKKQALLSFASLAGGTLIKYVPILNLPWLLWVTLSKKKNIQHFILLNLATMALFTYAYSSFVISVPFVSSTAVQDQFQVWYLFWTMPFVALLALPVLVIPAFLLCIGASSRYLPFMADFAPLKTVYYMRDVTVFPPIIGAIFLAFLKIVKIGKLNENEKNNK